MAVGVLAVVQARVGSTRLPGKALLPIAGRPMTAHVLERARAIPGVDAVALATTVDRDDDPLADLACALGVACVRGSVDDVLDRFRSALREHPADAVVRVTADCPLLDPEVSGKVVADFLAHGAEVDYVSNVEPPTFPDGLDTEVFRAAALERAWREAVLPSDREHVTTYMRRAENGFRRRNVAHGEDLSPLRLTVDEPRDLAFVRALYSALAPDGGRIFAMAEIVNLLRMRPELRAMNAGIARNEGLARSLRLDLAAPGAGKHRAGS
jgi:spore coat polysaccharide biosynthesis protein SpsF (cytidylyltransferase family)